MNPSRQEIEDALGDSGWVVYSYAPSLSSAKLFCPRRWLKNDPEYPDPGEERDTMIKLLALAGINSRACRTFYEIVIPLSQ